MQNRLITLLAHQGTYPIGLAFEIGLESAVAVNEMVKYGCLDRGGDRIGIISRFQRAGIKNAEDALHSLYLLGMLDGYNENSPGIKLRKEYFQDLDDLQVEIKSSIWQDKEFLALLAKWKSFLTTRGIRKSEKDLTAMFDGKDINAVKQALQYSIDNRFVTLFYNENNRGNAKTDSFNRRGRAVRGAGEGASGESKTDSQAPGAIHKGLESLD